MLQVPDKIIYLDHASTTAIHPELLADLNKLYRDYYENADALHYGGQRVFELVEQSRKALAQYFSVLPKEVIFTSGGTESNNNAIKGIALAYQDKGKHIICSAIEHSSVYESCLWLRDHFGFELSLLPVNKQGEIEQEALKKALRKDTILVSFMAVNNETGAVMNVRDLVSLVKKESMALVHVDGVQALAKHDFSLSQIDSAAFSAHKIGGLKGSGLWIKKSHVKVWPLISGGQQEAGYRGGTLNHIPAILWAKTLRLAKAKHDKHYAHIEKMHRYLYDAFRNEADVLINSSIEASPYIFNLSFKGVGSEIMLNGLMSKGFAVSAQATCNSRSLMPSRILLAMGRSEEEARNSLRISLDETLNQAICDRLIAAIKETYNYARNTL